jgi:hypothetical protein
MHQDSKTSYMKYIIYLLVPMLLSLSSFEAPYVLVTGLITDEKGNPVPLATVIVKGKNKGVLADSAGKFSINIEPDNMLIFYSANTVVKEVTVGNNHVINVTLPLNKQKTTGDVIMSGLSQIPKVEAVRKKLSKVASFLKQAGQMLEASK